MQKEPFTGLLFFLILDNCVMQTTPFLSFVQKMAIWD